MDRQTSAYMHTWMDDDKNTEIDRTKNESNTDIDVITEG